MFSCANLAPDAGTFSRHLIERVVAGLSSSILIVNFFSAFSRIFHSGKTSRHQANSQITDANPSGSSAGPKLGADCVSIQFVPIEIEYKNLICFFSFIESKIDNSPEKNLRVAMI